MSYQISFGTRNDLLVVYLRGRNNYVNAIKYWEKIAEVSNQLDYRKIMIEFDMEQELSPNQNVLMISHLLNLKLQSKKIAFVDHAGNDTLKRLFNPMVAKNLHLDLFFFEDLEKAEEWILSQSRGYTHELS